MERQTEGKRILYADRANADLFQRDFVNRGWECDIAQTIDKAAELSDCGGYDAIVWHFDMDCSEDFKRKHFGKLQWFRAFQQDAFRKDGELKMELVPGGGFYMAHLHLEAYLGLKILTSGAGRREIIFEPFIEGGLMHLWMGRILSPENLIDVLQDEFRLREGKIYKSGK